MTFEQVCTECIGNKQIVSEFNKLSGHKLSVHRSPIQKVIDDTCNYNPDKEALPDFCRFVFEYIWIPLLNKER